MFSISISEEANEEISRIIEEVPYSINWDVQFLPRKIFGRLWHGFKYILGCNGSDELHIEINEEQAMQLKSMINFVKNQEE